MLAAAVAMHGADKLRREIDAESAKRVPSAERSAAHSVRGRREGVKLHRVSFPGLPARLFDALRQLVAALAARETHQWHGTALEVDLCDGYLLPRCGPPAPSGGGSVYVQDMLLVAPAAAAKPPQVVLPGCQAATKSKAHVKQVRRSHARGGAAAAAPPHRPHRPHQRHCITTCPVRPVAVAVWWRVPQLRYARPAVRLTDGSTAQAVLCLRLSSTRKRRRGQEGRKQPWYLMCLPHQALDLCASSSSAAAAAAAARSGARAFAVPPTPDPATLQRCADHATNLGCYPLREVATADKAVLVPMTRVAARVTVVPVLPQHTQVPRELREARARPLVFVFDQLH